MMKCTLLLPILLWFGIAYGQADQRVPGAVIVKTAPGAGVPPLLAQLNRLRPGGGWTYGRALGPNSDLHLLEFDETIWPPDAALPQLRRLAAVEAAQFDYYVEPHAVPNDPLYVQQTTLERINLPDVWSITTGGITALGDTITVAVLDSGFDPTHADLQPNLWRNKGEVPNDGIDNDNNGYVDDIHGWVFRQSPPNNSAIIHGNSVAGIIGARGDNGLGITGVNWNVRLMLLSIDRVTEIVEAYQYVIEQRRRYAATLGAQGAFVVVTNASFGLEGVFCGEQPIWGGMYDQLGRAGILTAAAVANTDWNVDENGDMPTTCTSEFLIGVTNTDLNDELVRSAGFGPQSVDLGAPGEGSFTTRANNTYGGFCCTSAAAPHVSGTIALLYSLPCEALGRDIRDNPMQTALFMRQAILTGVTPLPSLAGKTSTGGRLDALGAMEYLQGSCGSTTGPLTISRLWPNPTPGEVTLEYEAPDYGRYTLRVFDALGRLVHRQEVQPPRFGDKKVSLVFAHLAKGMYFVYLEGAGQRTVQRFVKGG